MDVDTDIGVSEAKSQEGRKFFYRLTMGYLINILPADFNSITIRPPCPPMKYAYDYK